MIHTRTTGLMAALLLGALLLAGCGGGGGEPTVSQSVHDLLQHELDNTLTELRAERQAKAREAAARRTAEAQATRLTGEATRLTGERDTANAEVERLTGLIGAATDAANAAESASLHARLNHATAEVTRLTGLIGAATDAANAAESASLHAQLNHAEAEVTRLMGELTTANAKVTRLTAELDVTKKALDTTRQTLTTAQAAVTEAEEKVEEAQQQAQQEANQRVQGLEASQRARNLETAFGEDPTIAPDILTTSPIMITVPTSGSLRLQSGSKTATLRGTGIRSATITGTGAGAGKTVVYTNLELNRQLLKHYTPDTVDKTRLAITTPVGIPAETASAGAISLTSKNWKVTHGVSPTSLSGVNNDADPPVMVRPANPANPAPKASYPGTLHGVPGTFVCGGASCQIQLMPTYAGNEGDEGDSFALTTVTLTGDGGIFFKPTRSDATIPLRDGGPVGADGEYMVFGYWRDDSAGLTQFDTFAAAVGGAEQTTIQGTDTATPFPLYYDGKAVGAYVERDVGATVDTYRQGEFVATANLTATTASAITGRIHGFTATPIGGSAAPKTSRWVVGLNESNAAVLTLSGGATGDGQWGHAFVPVRTGDPDIVSPAVVGEFDVRASGLLSIVGAFGAEKRN